MRPSRALHPHHRSVTEQSAPRVVVVGSINTDIVVGVPRHPAPGETVIGSGGAERPGGKGANQAVAAARAGAQVVMVGAVGTDARAEAALAGLRAAGCDVTRVRRVPGPTGLALVTVASDGENSIVVVPGANAALGPADAGVLAQSAGLGAGDVLLLQGELPESATSLVAQLAQERGARVCLNLAPVIELPAVVVSVADPLVVNAHEAAGAARLLGVASGDVPDVAADPHAAVAVLLAAGVRSVVLTLGARGAVVADATGVVAVPAVPTRVVDTTGAGDSFTGACAAVLARGEALVDAAAAGARAAAETVAHEGAQPPDRAAADA